MKIDNCQSRLPYLTKVSFKKNTEIKTFQDMHKLKQFMITNPALQKILKEILHTNEEERQ
jgi:hypothetical protein